MDREPLESQFAGPEDGAAGWRRWTGMTVTVCIAAVLFAVSMWMVNSRDQSKAGMPESPAAAEPEWAPEYLGVNKLITMRYIQRELRNMSFSFIVPHEVYEHMPHTPTVNLNIRDASGAIRFTKRQEVFRRIVSLTEIEYGLALHGSGVYTIEITVNHGSTTIYRSLPLTLNLTVEPPIRIDAIDSSSYQYPNWNNEQIWSMFYGDFRAGHDYLLKEHNDFETSHQQVRSFEQGQIHTGHTARYVTIQRQEFSFEGGDTAELTISLPQNPMILLEPVIYRYEYEDIYDENGNYIKHIVITYKDDVFHQRSVFEYHPDGSLDKITQYGADGSIIGWSQWEYDEDGNFRTTYTIYYNEDGEAEEIMWVE